MTRKLIMMILVMALTALSLTLTPKTASASCSGDDCGCGTDMQECFVDCDIDYPPPSSTNMACRQGCIHTDVACARACCGGV
jgi:hypothetical protein